MRCWKTWIKAAGVCAIKTVAQTAVATIGTTAVLSEVDGLTAFSPHTRGDPRNFGRIWEFRFP